MTVTLEISVGEFIDRITILRLKVRSLSGADRAAARRQLAVACALRAGTVTPSRELRALTRRLASVNRELWNVEEELRACERAGHFSRRFVALARSVYKANDQRAALKRQIDLLVGESVGDRKSYPLPIVGRS